MKKPDIFKMLDVERKSLLRMPGNALKVWLFYWMKEGKERLGWSTEAGALEVLQMNRKTFYAARSWLVAHGWLKEITKRGRNHGEYHTAVFRVKEGTIPEKKDRRKENDPTGARATKKRLGLEAVAEFAVPAEDSESQILGQPVPKNGTGDQYENLGRDASQKTGREPSQKIREELDTVEVDTVESEPERKLVRETAKDSAPPDQNLETLFSEEQPQTQTLFNLLYPSGFESVALFNREAPHARACAEILAKENISAEKLLRYNRTHKPEPLRFRSCEQLHKALTAESQRTLNDFVGHDASSCRTCKALLMKDSNGKVLPSYRQNSGQRDIFGKGDI